MSNAHQSKTATRAIAVSFAFCILLALAAEWSSFQFVYGIPFSLASVFVLLAVRLFGLGLGLLSAVIVYSAGVWVADNSLFHLAGIAEAVFIGLMLHRYKGKLFSSAVVFWLLIGFPLCFMLHAGNSELNIKLYAGIITINALCNALLAEILYQYVPVSRWSGLSSIRRLPVSVGRLLVHLTLGVVMFSFIINIYMNSLNAFEGVSLFTRGISGQAVASVKQEWKTVSMNPTVPDEAGQVRLLQKWIDRHAGAAYDLSVTNNDRQVVASNNYTSIGSRLPVLKTRSLDKVGDSFYLSMPKNDVRMQQIQSWHNASFLYLEPLADGSGQFVVEIPLSNYQDYLFDKYTLHLIYLIGFAVTAASIAFIINVLLTRSLQRLAVTTRNLPLKLKQNNTLDLPKSGIVEIHSLIANFRHMAGNLLYLFHEAQQNNERLAAQAQLLQQSEERLHRLAFYDTLTGLPNRHSCLTHVQELIDESVIEPRQGDQRLTMAVFFVDINRFKQINDTLGHPVGDKLLQLAAQRFLEVAPDNCRVFRIGGDEFVLAGLNMRKDELQRLAQTICDSFAEPFVVDDAPLFLSASIGISQYPQDGTDTDTLIRNADIAMYNAREEGSGSYRFFQTDLLSVAEEKMRLENGLHKALLENQFTLHYQPKINASTGELCGIEALIRWHHPEFGMVPPDKFIPLAEDSGFILEIDSWVFREACRQNKEWQDSGLKQVSVSVNVSARHFYQGNLCAMIEKGLNETGLSPHYVCLEITEGVFMRNIDQVIETILYLRKLGIQISIDDFGTGYSSLNQLQRLPISDVKLDRSFIRGITKDEKKSSIVKAIIELVHSMNMKVVAEGVETAAESQFCKDMNCDELQGYLFSRPLPATQMETMLRS